MLDFTAAPFALAGLAAAAGPVIIHLLNRRRFRVVPWAAMDFLRDALAKQRRILHLRDLILLVLRVLALVLLGLTLARPFFTGGSGGPFAVALMISLFALAVGFVAAGAMVASHRSRVVLFGLGGACAAQWLALGGWLWQSSSANAAAHTAARGPVHAVLVVDNSRSLGVQTAAGTRLDRAKSRVLQFLDTLPPDSRITLIPLAGSLEPFPQDPFRSKDDARRALDRLGLVDITGDVDAALEQARLACETTPEVPTKRVAVLSDYQTAAWSAVDWPKWAEQLPDLQLAPLADELANNLWIAHFELEDGIAGTEAPARFLAQLSATGPQASSSVQAVLTVDGVEVGSQVVDLGAGQTRAVEFVHQFDIPGAAGRPQWTSATLELLPETPTADQLAADNRTVLLAPIVAALPIVFVDQWGDQEHVAQGRIGETYALRHLLAPRMADELSPRRVIQALHVRPEQVTTELLETARLVVVAGLETPGEMVPVLRDYVVQGGPLVLLAGAGFDPVAWQETAWLNGEGILAAPLKPQPVGALPQETNELRPFFADFQTMQHEEFLVSGEDPQSLASLFDATPFFKAVQADVSTETLSAWQNHLLSKLTDDLQFLRMWDDLRRRGVPSDSVALGAYREAEQRARQLEPTWWAWRSPLPLWDRGATPAQLVDLQQPRVRAWFQDRQTPWVVERRIGAGQVMFWSSGVTSDWNLLRSSGAMYVFHRACHRLLENTLPRRNYQAGDRIALPLATADDVRYFVERPTGDRESLLLEALGPNVSGLIVRRPLHAGLYAMHTESAAPAANRTESEAATAWQLAVQAPAGESDLTTLSPWELQTAVGTSGIRVLGVDEPLRLEGGRRRGQSLWKWCAAAMLALLLIEMAVLSAPAFSQERAA
jgi:hypothetical protein